MEQPQPRGMQVWPRSGAAQLLAGRPHASQMLKSYPCTDLGRPRGPQKANAPRTFRQSAYEVGKVVSPTHHPPLTPKGYPWYSFLLEAESTPGPQCGQKDQVSDKVHCQRFVVAQASIIHKQTKVHFIRWISSEYFNFAIFWKWLSLGFLQLRALKQS